MNNTEQGIEKVAIGLISETLGLKHALIKQDSRLKEDLGADSLDTLEIITAVESIYKFDISEKDIQEIKTVGDICQNVNAYKGKGLII